MSAVRKLVASGELPAATKQLVRPCTDCPMRRDAISGWLGAVGSCLTTPEEYCRLAHSDAIVDCHVHAGSRCAGMAIYRTNVVKRQPEWHALPADHDGVFSTPMEFVAHHTRKKKRKAK